MKNTRATRILATVFHKHKYITNTDVTPEDCVIAAAGKLAYELKGCITLHLSETTLDQFSALGLYSSEVGHRRFSSTLPGTPPLHPPSRTEKCTSHSQKNWIWLNCTTQGASPHSTLPTYPASSNGNTSDITDVNTSKGGASSKSGATPEGGTPSDAKAITPTGVPTQ